MNIYINKYEYFDVLLNLSMRVHQNKISLVILIMYNTNLFGCKNISRILVCLGLMSIRKTCFSSFYFSNAASLLIYSCRKDDYLSQAAILYNLADDGT